MATHLSHIKTINFQSKNTLSYIAIPKLLHNSHSTKKNKFKNEDVFALKFLFLMNSRTKNNSDLFLIKANSKNSQFETTFKNQKDLSNDA